VFQDCYASGSQLEDDTKKEKKQSCGFSLGGIRLAQEPPSCGSYNELASVDHWGYDRKRGEREREVIKKAAQLVDQQQGEVCRAGDEREEGGGDRGGGGGGGSSLLHQSISDAPENCR